MDACLVTPPIKGRSPARGEDEYAVVLSTMHAGEDEDDLLSDILTKRYVGWRWVVAWVVLVGFCWAAAACSGKHLSSFIFFLV
jgi:hypothetical protein